MKPGDPRRRAFASLSPKLYREFLACAEKEQITKATLVRQALAAYLDRPRISPGRAWELDELRPATGLGKR